MVCACLLLLNKIINKRLLFTFGFILLILEAIGHV
nr:MAG TPA: hypothetical protein [Caudoviricetes sp.]